MNPIDLGTTRLADKLEGAVGVDIYAAAKEAIQSYTAVRTAPVTVSAPAYKPCSICNSKWLLWAGIAVAAFMLMKVA